jgi:signal transduction histidine kinase/ligand-binding sensor domain-containing protein
MHGLAFFQWILSAIPYLILLGLAVNGNAQHVSFSHITTENSLLSGNIRALAEDHQGFIWIGTEDGLQRYDGYSMVTYKYQEQDSTSIGSNIILKIYEDHFHNLWIGTMKGLCLYNRHLDNFKRIRYSPANPRSINGDIVRAIFRSSTGTLYYGFDANGFCYYTPAATNPTPIQFNRIPISTDTLNHYPGWVTAFAELPDQAILVGGQRLFRFDPLTKGVSQVVKEQFYSGIRAIKVDSKHRIWVSTYGQGLFIYDEAYTLLVHHVSKNEAGYLNTDQIEDILEDKDGNTWITSDAGLHLIPAGTDPLQEHPFRLFVHEEAEPNSLLGNSIKAALLDSHDRLWTGSYFAGINVYDKNAFKFFPVTSRAGVNGSLPDDNVFSFEYDLQDNLWIGTDGGGLAFIHNPAKNLYRNLYQKVELLSASHRPVKKIKSLKRQGKNSLWIGTWGEGLFRLDLTTRRYTQFKNIPGDSKTLCGNEVMHLEVDSLNNLWIGTFSGLDKLNLSTLQFKHYPNLNFVEDSHQVDQITAIHRHGAHLWIAHEVFGLFNYDYTSDSFHHMPIPGTKDGFTITSIYHDPSGTLWLGSHDHGLVRYDPQLKETTFFDEQNGLANTIVNAVLGDVNSNRLWVSTNSGLSEFNKETQAFTNYNHADGLQGTQYNPGCAYYLEDSLMLFGGTKGFDAFNPENIGRSDIFPIVFTRFRLNNTELSVGKGPLSKNIIVSDTLILNYDHNAFSIEFAMLEFNPARRNQYRFQMKGFSDEWSMSQSDRKATFTNLDPGTYRLNVQATNSDQVWSPATRTMVIIILPAWWQTTAFKVVLGLLLIMITYAGYSLRLRYLLASKANLELQVKERTTEVQKVNLELASQLEKISYQNKLLEESHEHIAEKNSEIQAQNEELIAQHDQITEQREKLEHSQRQLREINENLEHLVRERTRTLEETISKLDKTVAELDRFVYSASHDLSAPLKSVVGLVNIARREKDHTVLQQYYDYIERSITKLDKVIKSLVEFARNSHQPVSVEQFDLRELVMEIIQEFSFWPEAQSVQCACLIEPEFIIITDRPRLNVALHNIIGNSLKYSDKHKEQSFIRIAASRDEGDCVITIEDNGIGIKAEHHSRVFDMYYRASDISKGSGLGLFIVKEIALKLNATLDMQSEFGVGTTFTLRIRQPHQR